MDFVEYVLIFQSIIAGFIVSYIFSQWGSLFHPETKLHPIPFLLSISLFLHLLFRWWFDFYYRLNPVEYEGLLKYLYSFIRPVLLYLCAIVLFTAKGNRFTYQEVFYKNIRLIFFVFALMWGFDVFDWGIVRGKDLNTPHRLQPLINAIFSVWIVFFPRKWLIQLALIAALSIQLILFVVAGIFW